MCVYVCAHSHDHKTEREEPCILNTSEKGSRKFENGSNGRKRKGRQDKQGERRRRGREREGEWERKGEREKRGEMERGRDGGGRDGRREREK